MRMQIIVGAACLSLGDSNGSKVTLCLSAGVPATSDVVARMVRGAV